MDRPFIEDAAEIVSAEGHPVPLLTGVRLDPGCPEMVGPSSGLLKLAALPRVLYDGREELERLVDRARRTRRKSA
jgi:hypothetical protein